MKEHNALIILNKTTRTVIPFNNLHVNVIWNNENSPMEEQNMLGHSGILYTAGAFNKLINAADPDVWELDLDSLLLQSS